MDYKEFAKRIHEIAVKRGDENCSNDDYRMMVMVEVSNAVMAYDKKKRVRENITVHYRNGQLYDSLFLSGVFGTVEDCFANIVIRLMEFADKRGIPADYKTDYEEKFEHLSFTEAAYRFITTCLTCQWTYPNVALAYALRYMENWAEYLGIDLEFFVNAEMAYYESINGVAMDKEIV